MPLRGSARLAAVGDFRTATVRRRQGGPSIEAVQLPKHFLVTRHTFSPATRSTRIAPSRVPLARQSMRVLEVGHHNDPPRPHHCHRIQDSAPCVSVHAIPAQRPCARFHCAGVRQVVGS